MTITEAASRLQTELTEKFGRGQIFVGHAKNSLRVYEIATGYENKRVRPEWLPEEFGWDQFYIGKPYPIES